MTLAKVAAPFIPFLSEALYLDLKREQDPESVHLCDFPQVDDALRDVQLEEEMAEAQTVVSCGHSLRKKQKIKVRQPLKKAHVICAHLDRLNALKRQEDLICSELNVHAIEFSEKEEEFVQLFCRPNFRILGKKVGPKMRAMQSVIDAFSIHQMQTLLAGKTLDVTVEGESFTLTPEDVQVERKVRKGLVARTEAGITVALDIELNEELLLEGIARELINKMNTMRRDAGFYVTDRVEITIQTTDRVKQALDAHQDLIMHEVLGVSLEFGENDGDKWDINGEKTAISLRAVDPKATS